MHETMDLFEAAKARAEDGMTRAVDHADRVAPGWSDRALTELRLFARVQTGTFTIEKARESIVIDAPPDSRSWGSVTQTAIKRSVIVKTGEYAPASSSNGSPKMLYRRGPGA